LFCLSLDFDNVMSIMDYCFVLITDEEF